MKPVIVLVLSVLTVLGPVRASAQEEREIPIPGSDDAIIRADIVFTTTSDEDVDKMIAGAEPLPMPQLPPFTEDEQPPVDPNGPVYGEPLFGDPSLTGGIATLVPRSERFRAPAASVGKLFFKLNGKDYVCSAQLVGNFDVVVTAGHCVYDNRVAATDIYFAPLYPIPGIGRYQAVAAYTSLFWRAYRNFEHDYAVIKLKYPVLHGMSALGFIARPNFRHFEWTAYGYPAEGRFDGQSLFHVAGSGPILDRLPFVKMASDMTRGSSGGGWINNNRVVGVNSHTRDGVPNTVYSAYLGTGFCIALRDAAGLCNP
ncbi:trypsin-like serine peptidase [Shimia biformata]|uniref:trypsin-like serine peptidase n=1 Tax=Shimia biformata TaxID=1294299 RepID=UPI00194EDD35|nr:trypsin-like serine protease [Shimia biformata]